MEGTNQQKNMSLVPLVGPGVYSVWLEMLRTLVPTGRTHRLQTVIAGMLQFAMLKTKGTSNQESEVTKLLRRGSEPGDTGDPVQFLFPVVEELLRNAGVPNARVSSKGKSYSLADAAIREFVIWPNMPWE
jgi:hypothetical protein